MASIIIFLDDCGLHVVQSRTGMLFSSEKCKHIQQFGNHFYLICRCCDEPTRAPCSWKHHSPPWLWGCSSCTSSTPAGWCMALCTLNLATAPKVTNASCPFWRGTLNYRFIHSLSGCFWLLWARVHVSDLWFSLSSWVFTLLCSPTLREDTPWSTKKTYLMWTASLRGLAFYNI